MTIQHRLANLERAWTPELQRRSDPTYLNELTLDELKALLRYLERCEAAGAEEIEPRPDERAAVDRADELQRIHAGI